MEPITLLDISYAQGVFDWNAAAPEIDGAIIRCCSYNRNADCSIGTDTQFERNVSEAERLGIPFGFYVYSYALNVENAVREARAAIKLAAGHNLSYPIFFDSEFAETASVAAACAKAFCAEVEEAGFKSGVYASRNWWANYLEGVNPGWKWVAAWGTNSGKPEMNFRPADADIWQYTSNGSLAGRRVDLNLCYRETEDEPAPEFPESGVITGGNGEKHSFEQGKYLYRYSQFEDGRLEYDISDWFAPGTGKLDKDGNISLYYLEKTLYFPRLIDAAAPAFVRTPFVYFEPRKKGSPIAIALQSLEKDRAAFRAYSFAKDIPYFYVDVFLRGRWK